MKTINLFFDMDGVLAKWQPCPVEDTHQKGYFLNREPDPLMVRVIKRFEREYPAIVKVLSSVYQNGYAEQEKREWLRRQGIKSELIAVPYGEKKSNYIRYEDEGVELFVLVDDYTNNLNAWESDALCNVGIKYYNGINGTKGTWNGSSIHRDQSVENVINKIKATSVERWFSFKEKV